MTNPQTPFDEMMRLGQDWAKTMSEASNAFTPEALEKLWPTMPKEAFFGRGLNPEGLDAKTRLLLTLQGLVVQGTVAETQVRLTLRHALEAGATEHEIKETLGLAGLFGGAPAMTKALHLFQAIQDDTA